MPGRFKPDQIKPLADSLGLTIKELFDRHLAVNWWYRSEDKGGSVFILAPVLKGEQAGHEYPGDPRGTCVWFNGGKCAIHDKGKPFECAAMSHDHEREDVTAITRDIVAAWENPAAQKMIADLLGRAPTDEISIVDVFGLEDM